MWKVIVHLVFGGEETSVISILVLGKEKNNTVKLLLSIQFDFVYIATHLQESNVPYTSTKLQTHHS